MKVVYVAAAVLQKKDEGLVLVVQRPENKALPNYWECPGGKIETGESPEQALKRELKEELDLNVDIADMTPISFKSYLYEETHVVILFYLINRWSGEIQLLEGQKSFQWIEPHSVNTLQMPPANKGILEILTLKNTAGNSNPQP